MAQGTRRDIKSKLGDKPKIVKPKTGKPKTGKPKTGKPGNGELALRQSVIDTCLKMNAAGINQGTSGNVSLRHGDGFLITPSGVAYDRLTPKMIVQMDLDGGYFGDLKPSSEWRMHFDIYRTRPEAQAVVHTHSNYATAVSSLREGIPAFHYMIAVTGGPSLRCANYATFGTKKLSENMLAAMEERKATLLANHGVICFEENLDKALWLAGEIENLAKQYTIARQCGDPKILNASEMRRVQEKFKTYGKQDASEALREEDAVRRDAPVPAASAKKGRGRAK